MDQSPKKTQVAPEKKPILAFKFPKGSIINSKTGVVFKPDNTSKRVKISQFADTGNLDIFERDHKPAVTTKDLKETSLPKSDVRIDPRDVYHRGSISYRKRK